MTIDTDMKRHVRNIEKDAVLSAMGFSEYFNSLDPENRMIYCYAYIEKQSLYYVRKRFQDIKAVFEIDQDFLAHKVAGSAFKELNKEGFFARSDHTGVKSYMQTRVRWEFSEFLDRERRIEIEPPPNGDDGKPVDVIEILPSPDLHGDNEAIAKEYAERVFPIMKECFFKVKDTIRSQAGKDLFHVCFWYAPESEGEWLNVKQTAQAFNYNNANPTQFINRKVEAFTHCMKQKGITDELSIKMHLPSLLAELAYKYGIIDEDDFTEIME